VHSSPEGGTPGAEFILPRRDVVHPENWVEWQEKGFVWRRNASLEPDETALTTAGKAKGLLERDIGLDNVVTGDPFDRDAGHPVRREGEYGVYWRPPENR
jgi:hypothetical protein